MKRGSIKVLPLMLFLLITAVALFTALLSLDSGAQESQEMVPEPNMTIELSKTQYTKGEVLQGKIKLKLTNNTLPDSMLTLRVPGNPIQRPLVSLLSNSSVNFTIINGSYEGVNPSSTKTLQIIDGEKKKLGVSLPAYSEIKSFDMLVSGPADNQLKNPQMDIGADGIIEWYYLGNLISWNTQSSKPLNLNEMSGEKIFLNNPNTIYCQKINLSFGKDFNVSVSYKSLGKATDLKAVIYSIAGGDAGFPQGGDDNCDLPESINAGYHSCASPIHLNSAEKGDHLVCVYYNGDVNENAYEIDADTNTQSSTSYVCQKEDPIYCDPAPFSNYFIKVYGASYSQTINSGVNFGEWSLGVNASLNALRQEIGSDPYLGRCAPGLCLVPIEISGIGSGTLTLGSLAIEYESGDVVKVAGRKDQLYDVVRKPNKFHTINGIPLDSNITVEIPLALFNLTAEAPRAMGAVSANGSLQAGFNSQFETSETFTVFFDAVPATGSRQLIDEARNAINALPADEDARSMLEVSGIDAKAKEISALLPSLEAKLVSGDTPELQNEVTTAILQLPKEVKVLGSISDIQLIEPNDITNDIAPSDKKEETYFLQDDVSITIRIKKYLVTDFSGNAKELALVKKTIKAKKNLNKIDVYETISKNSATSLDSVKFQETPKIVNEDPVIKWFLQSLSLGQSKVFTYVVEGSVGGIDDFKSIIVPSGPELCGNRKCDPDEDEDSCPGDCKPLSKCGDGVCTQDLEDAKTCPKDCKGKFPWLYVISGGLILISILALFLTKGRKRSPFKNDEDLKSIIAYIKSAKQKKIKNDDITKGLMQRGWTKEQVDFALEEYFNSVNTKPIEEYLINSLNKKVPLATIKQKLVAQGWDESLVDKEIKKLTK